MVILHKFRPVFCWCFSNKWRRIKMNVDDIYTEMKRLAKQNNVELTDTAENLARFRARTGLPMSKCPCSPGDIARGCISIKCMHEINTFGTCHCQAYKKGV
jgi:hypothetical protein